MQVRQSLQAFDRAIELDPQFEVAWYGKGKTLCLQYKYDEALEAFDQVIELNPQEAQN